MGRRLIPVSTYTQAQASSHKDLGLVAAVCCLGGILGSVNLKGGRWASWWEKKGIWQLQAGKADCGSLPGQSNVKCSVPQEFVQSDHRREGSRCSVFKTIFKKKTGYIEMCKEEARQPGRKIWDFTFRWLLALWLTITSESCPTHLSFPWVSFSKLSWWCLFCKLLWIEWSVQIQYQWARHENKCVFGWESAL